MKLNLNIFFLRKLKMPIILSLCFAFFCGMVFPLQKLVIQNHTPFYAISLRFAVTALAICPFLKSSKQYFGKLFLTASFFMVGPFAGQGFAMKSIDAGICAMSTQIAPILLILWGVFVLKETITTQQILGTILAFIGVGLITLSPEIKGLSLEPVFALVFSIISYTIGTLILRSIKLKPLQIMLWGYFLASFQLITLTSLTEQSFFRSVAETEPWIFLLSLTIGLLSIGGNALLTYLISNYPLSKVMPFSLTLPFSLF